MQRTGDPKPLAFHLDPLRRARSRDLKATIAQITEELLAHEAVVSPRTRRRKPEDAIKFRLAVEVVVCNSVAMALASSTAPLGVPRSNTALYPPKRYRHEALGEHFLTVLDLMCDPAISMLEDLGRGFRIDRTQREVSTVRPTTQLLSRLSAASGWDAIGFALPPEVLILHGERNANTGKAVPITYSDTANTRRMRREVRELNARLQAAPISVLPAGPGDSPIDPTQRSLRRIFNNGSWQAGGRLFGGFWETMPKAERFRRIRIDGERIASADYGQLFTWLLYAQAGLEAPEGDLYEFGLGGAEERPAWKVLVNAMLFADGELMRWPEDALGIFPAGTKLRDLTSRIKHRHAAVAGAFGTGEGFRMMLRESTMLIGALDRLAAQGVTGLPVHDAVLVPASAANLAVTAMTDSAEALGYPRARVSVER